MTRAQEKRDCAFIASALEVRHLLNCVPHDSDLTPEDREECLAWRPLSDACVRFAHVLRRHVWKAWEEQRQEQRTRKRAAQRRKRDAQKRTRQQAR